MSQVAATLGTDFREEIQELQCAEVVWESEDTADSLWTPESMKRQREKPLICNCQHDWLVKDSSSGGNYNSLNT